MGGFKRSIVFLAAFALSGIFVYLFPSIVRAGEYTNPNLCGGKYSSTCSCGDYVAGDVTFDKDIGPCDGYADHGGDKLYYGLRVVPDGDPNDSFTIDCQGHKIFTDKRSTYGPIGIDSSYDRIKNSCLGGCQRNVTIKNCVFEGFKKGMKIADGTGWKIDNNTIIGRYNENTVWKVLPVEVGIEVLHDPIVPKIVGLQVTNNDILEATYQGIVIYRLGESSILSGNRITIYQLFDDPLSTNAAAIRLVEPRGTQQYPIEISGNYLDCDDQPGGFKSYCGSGDIYLSDAYGFAIDYVKIFNNVFSGKGVKFSPWNSASNIDYSGSPYNIFSNVNLLESDGSCDNNFSDNSCDPDCDTALDPACSGLPDSAKNYVKRCIMPTADVINFYYENQCFQKEANITFTKALKKNEAAIKIMSDNVILDCNRTAADDVLISSNENSLPGIGILAQGKKRGTLIGCVIDNFTTGISLEQSEDFLLRWNMVKKSSSPKNGRYYKIWGDKKEHYRHKIYNPSYRYEDPNIRIGPMNVILEQFDIPYQTLRVLYYYGDDKRIINGDGTDSYLTPIGHLTVANSKDIGIQNVTISQGDPITLAFLSAESNTNFCDGEVRPCSYILDNRVSQAFYGLQVFSSSKLVLQGNTFKDNGQYGAYFQGVTESLIGEDNLVKGNTFQENDIGGLYFLGGYFFIQSHPEKNIIQNNTFEKNGFFGIVATNIFGNKFLDNTIQNNGTRDDSDSTVTNPECNDGLDNDGDGAVDLDDIDCVGNNDPYESSSPGFYLNQAKNNIIQNNNFDSNSGDNLYIDSTVMPDTNNSCEGSALPTLENIIVGNTMQKSKHGSGILIDRATCILTDTSYDGSGSVYRNWFGYFYLREDRRNYATSPIEEEAISLNASFSPWNSTLFSSTPPLKGDNTLKDNKMDGITLYGRDGGSLQEETSNRISLNDFFGNKFLNNQRYGIYIFGKAERSYANDIVDNTLSNNNQGGILLDNSRLSRVFGNTLTNNNTFGIQLKNLAEEEDYIEIGNEESCNSCQEKVDYANVIQKWFGSGHKRGVVLQDDQYSVVDSNQIKHYSEYGILGLNSKNAKIHNNTVTAGGDAGYSVGIAIMDSQNWKLQNNMITDISPNGRYLYVGVKREFGADKTATLSDYPYPTLQVKEYYKTHSIDQTNRAGPQDKEKAIYYLVDSPQSPAGTLLTYHYQTVSPQCGNGLTAAFDGADPIEIDFFDTSGCSGVPGAIFDPEEVKNCRGECFLLYGINYDRTYVGKNLSIKEINIDTAQESGIKAFYTRFVEFSGINISKVNQRGFAENGGMYFYYSRNNIIKNNQLTYKPSQLVPDQKKWEMFFFGDSNENSVQGNTFGSTKLSGSGAFEWRPGKIRGDDPDPAQADDDFCVGVSGDGVCDPNCTRAQDSDCPSSGAQCTKNSGDCCFDISDDTSDFDCLFGVDPDAAPPTAVLGADDGICVYDVSGGICDPNCTVNASIACAYQYSAGCQNSAGDCCEPEKDGVCDYDCPAGFDPDCVPNSNDWCRVENNFNLGFDSSGNSFNKPNYYEQSLFDALGVGGGGGRPNDSYFCYEPKVRISKIEQGDWEHNSRGYRDLPIYGSGTNQRSRYKYKFKTVLDFADLYGLNLEARIFTGQDSSNINPFEQSDFYDYPPPIHADDDPGPPPGIDNTSQYALGTLDNVDVDPIRTPVFSGDYSNPFQNSQDYSEITVYWDAYNNNSLKLKSKYQSSGEFYARLQARNTKSQVGATGSGGGQGEDFQFSYDFKSPVPSSLGWGVSVTSQGDKTFKITWNSIQREDHWHQVSGSETPRAHYEVWYGKDKNDVSARRDTNSDPSDGPYVCDDLKQKGQEGSSPFPREGGASCDSDCATSQSTLDKREADCLTISNTGVNIQYVNVCAVDNFGNENCSEVPEVKPWLQTKYGDIYAGENIGDSSGADLNYSSRNVSTFLILAAGNDISQYWASECSPEDIQVPGGSSLQNCKDPNFSDLDFPKPDNQYTTSLGSLDYLNHYDGNENYDFIAVVNDLKKRYGIHRVIQVNNLSDLPTNLNGSIYYLNRNGTIGAKTFTAAADQNGSGLIIVNGNLTINGNITYDDTNVDSLRTLPSVAWIVLGDITVNPSVTELNGAYIALGKPANSPSCPPLNNSSDGCGRISTGNSNFRLTVKGLMMARQFHFERTLAEATQGAEVIIYDGRLQANTPLGLEDFAKNLPIWK